MVLGIVAIRLLDVENPDVQTALCCDGSVFLPERAGGGISGILCRCLPVLFLLLHQCGKAGTGHIHLPTHLQKRRCAMELPGNVGNGAEIRCDILPHESIPTSRATGKYAVGIFQRHRQSVDFRFYDKFRLRNCLLTALKKRIDLCKRENVLKAHHLHGMLHLVKSTGDTAAHMMSRGIRRSELRILLFQRLQLPHPHIILIVRHGRIVLHIILFVIGFQKFPEF